MFDGILSTIGDIFQSGTDWLSGFGNALSAPFSGGFAGVGDWLKSMQEPAGGVPSLPSVDDYSGGYGNAPTGVDPVTSLASGGSSMFSSAADILKGGAALAASPAATGALSYYGTQQTNEMNKSIADAANVFNATQAQMNRDFQERMSNTSWSRGVADMERAGLNPMLAYAKGGATQPGGSSASAVVPNMGNAMAGAINSSQAASSVNASVDKMREEAKLVDAQRGQVAVEAQRIVADTAWIWAKRDYTEQDRVKLFSDIGKTLAETGFIKGPQTDKVVNEIVKIVADEDKSRQEKVNLVTENLLMRLGVPRASNEANSQSSWWMRNVSPYLPDFLKGATGAATVRGLGR